MPVEETKQEIGTLINQVSAGEIRLPEIQRGYVWKPTQVAKLVDSLYRGYPSGSLLFWRTTEVPETREMAVGTTPGSSPLPPLFLLDGQQRLTSLHRVFTDALEAQIVFNVETEVFQNQSAATANDARWIKVHDVLRKDADLFEIHAKLLEAGVRTGSTELGRRLSRLAGISQRKFYMEILTDFGYDEVAQIFVRVNSGRALKTSDLALVTLSARWPGVLEKLQDEADHWAHHHYRDLDIMFLTRALTGAVLGRGLSTWSHSRLAAATDEELEQGLAHRQAGAAPPGPPPPAESADHEQRAHPVPHLAAAADRAAGRASACAIGRRDERRDPLLVSPRRSPQPLQRLDRHPSRPGHPGRP
ncbi:DUF262 domain-containing protein [Actinomadura meridiana]